MKLFIFVSFLVIAVIASPFTGESEEAEELIKIPDGHGGWRYVTYEETLEVDPLFVPADDMRFLLFTQANPLTPQILQWNDMSTVSSSNWLGSRPTRIIAHGWQR